MTSEKQIAANRRNAARSTGPRRRAGKRRSNENSRKHGLLAKAVLTPDENPADYEAFRDEALASLKPVGFLETQLATNIIDSSWRKRRCARMEAGLLGGGKHVMDEIEATDSKKFARMLEHNVSPQDFTLSQLLLHVMVQRVEANFAKRVAKVPLSSHGSDDDDDLFAHLSNEDLVQDFLKAREEEHQNNPLAYDISLAFKRDSSEEDALTKLARYEAALDRSLHRALCEFRRLQAERKKEERSADNVIDVIDWNRSES